MNTEQTNKKYFYVHLDCLEKNTEKYLTFPVYIEKEVIRIDKKGEEIRKTISHK